MAKPSVTADQSAKEVAELKIGSTYTPFTSIYPDPNFLAPGSWSVTHQLYEGLTGFRNRDTIVPLLAESWTTPDDTTWVFKLKQNVKLHDGSVLTAEDVSRSIDRAAKDENSLPLLVSTIDSVTAQDDNTVVIKTTAPDPILLNKLVYLFVQGEQQVNGAAAGTGAYIYSSETPPTETTLNLVAFDDYHGGKPAVRKVAYIGYESEDAMLEAVKKGEIDISDLLPAVGVNSEEVAGFTKSTIKDGFIGFLGINSADTSSPLSKLPVRQALRLSIDPATYIKNYGVLGQPASQLTLQENFGYNPDVKVVTRDVAKAKELLKEAGYPNGVELSVSFEDTEANNASFNELKRQAAEAGITLEAAPEADFEKHLENITNGDFEIYSLSASSALIDSYDLFAFNVYDTSYTNQEYFDLLEQSNTEFDTAERKELMQQISKLLVDDGVILPLVEWKSAYYVRDNLNYQVDTGSVVVGGYIRTISAK